MRKILSVKNLLLVLALAIIASMAIGATSVKAEDPEVSPAPEVAAEAANDVLEYAPDTDSIQVKAAAAKDTYFLYLLKKDEAVKVSTRTAPVEITKGTPLNIIETFKIKPDKDLLIYCSTAPIEAGKSTGKANFKIGATPYSKLTIAADYTALDTADGCGIATIVATKKADKKNLVIFNKYAEGVDAAKRAAKAAEDAVWEWSEDGTTWQAAKTCKLTLNTTAYIRVKGDATANIRCSKVYKIKFAKEQKAKTVKVDVKKMTIALKNGYEYAVKPESEETALSWTVILPYNKNSKNAESELAGANYIPVDKKDEAYNTTYSTKTKVSSISIIDIENYQRGIYVRSSATLKKPATPESLVEIPEMTTAPVVKIEGQEAAAAKGDVIVKGTAIEFDMPAVENGTGDENAAVYELAVIKKANFTDVNWATVSWKKVKPNAKKAVKATLKTKYTAGTTKVEAKVSDSGTMIVVRRAGVKAGNILPSKLLVLCVDKVDKDYYLRVNALNLAYDAETAPEALAAPEVPAEPQPEPSPEP